MSRRLPLLTSVVLSLLFVALAACGGGGEEKATPTPAEPTGATPTQPAEGTPLGPSLSGSATATVMVGDQIFAFKDGRCDRGADDAWLAVNIGQVAGSDYFGLLVGAHPGTGPDVKPAKEGGVFTEGILVTATQGSSTFTMGPGEGNKVILTPDLNSGEFEGSTLDGQPIFGSFQC
jgi:hypothetical protein